MQRNLDVLMNWGSTWAEYILTPTDCHTRRNHSFRFKHLQANKILEENPLIAKIIMFYPRNIQYVKLTKIETGFERKIPHPKKHKLGKPIPDNKT